MVSFSDGGAPLSRLVLGTAQFGLPYGVANAKGQPSYAEVVEILSCALEGGVTVLDTAPGYGQSEEVLGRALAELSAADSVTVVSKISPLAPNLTPVLADELVEASVANSLRRLRLEVLPVCLFHREENYCYVESLLKLQQRGLVRQIGASTMLPQPAREIVEAGVQAVQIPASLLDWRFQRAGVLRAATQRQTTVFVRSIYLQGLLLMPESQIPADLTKVVSIRRQLENRARDAGMTMAELAARTILTLEGVAGIVVGVETVEQMKSNLELFARGPLEQDLVENIKSLVPALPDEVLMPNLWAKRMADTVPVGSRASAHRQNDS